MWRAIGTPFEQLAWIAWGAQLRFLQRNFVSEEIAARLKSGHISCVDKKFARCVNPLNVVRKASGGFRLILDCRFPNGFLPHIAFRMENLFTVPLVVEPGDWLFTVDLCDAYYHLSMHDTAKPFLCFEWQSKYYTCNALPFGLSLAPFLFTKLTRPVTSFCRAIGISVVAYLDDFLWADKLDRIEELKEFILWLMGQLGFTVSTKKSQLDPSQLVQFLGLLFDSKRFSYHVLRRSCRR